MKKILFTALTALTITGASAQGFLTKTCYRGAFAPAPAPMWTDTWTEWDPQNKVYPAPTMTVNANITSNTTWAAGSVVLLQGPIYVTGNSVLTVAPGVIVRGAVAIAGSGLFITRGSQLIAQGTMASPIVFTSDQAPGGRLPGDWGGVILMGNANNNNPGGTNNIEGITASPLTLYGGGTTPNDNESSGTLEYVRIEFGGFVYASNKEINGLTMGAVGRGTKIDYVQCSFINDDAFEWFGGAVNCKHLVAYRCVDDNFDTDNGFSGTVQFCLGVRDPNLADPTYALPSGSSTSEAFESDNDPTGTTATPVTSAIFSNVTDIGPLRGVLSATCHAGFRRGARIRRNSSLKIINSILMDHKTRALFIDGALSENNAIAGSLIFKNNILAGYGQKATETVAGSTFSTAINTWVANNPNDTLLSSANILTNPYNYMAPDYRPAANSIALAGASYTDPIIAAATGTLASMAVVNTPTAFCVGDGGSVTTPFIFIPSTTVTPNYCGVSWNVSPGVTMSSSTAANPSFTITTAGNFTIFMTVVDANGSSTGMSAILTTTCTDVSIKENTSIFGSINMYPNPAKDLATLSVNSANVMQINVSVYDIAGKLVLSPVQNQRLITGENTFVVDTQELQNGIYFVTLNSSNGKETVKLVVNK